MKRILAIGLCLLLAAGCLAAAADGVYYVENEWNYVDRSMDVSGGIPEDAEGVLASIRRKGVLRVAVDRELTPRVFYDASITGRDPYAGADIELALRIAERMGVTLQIVPMESTQILPCLSEDRCDLAISAVTFTPGRAVAYSLSKAYYYPETGATTGILIRAEDAETITSADALAGKTVIVQGNSLQETVAVRYIRNYMEMRRVSSIQTVYEAVQNGKVDAAVVDLTSAGNYLSRNPDCGMILVEGVTFTPEKQYLGDRVAAKKGEEPLMYFINGVIDEVTADGTYERWLDEAQRRADRLGL